MDNSVLFLLEFSLTCLDISVCLLTLDTRLMYSDAYNGRGAGRATPQQLLLMSLVFLVLNRMTLVGKIRKLNNKFRIKFS